MTKDDGRDMVMREAIKLTIADASYHLKKYRPHCLEALTTALSAAPASPIPISVNGAGERDVERHLSHETVCGFRVAAYRETHPEHGAKYGHSYSEHWSTPNTRHPDVKVERLFTEDQLRAALSPALDNTAVEDNG